MNIRQANRDDIKELFSVRMSVKENVLNNTALVTDAICEDYLVNRGKGWLCEESGSVTGFAIADLLDNSIWALFVRPEHEGKGIGRKLHDTMMDWYFSKTNKTAWLTTAPNTRAEKFYTQMGWQNKGIENKEMKFEMAADNWNALKSK